MLKGVVGSSLGSLVRKEGLHLLLPVIEGGWRWLIKDGAGMRVVRGPRELGQALLLAWGSAGRASGTQGVWERLKGAGRDRAKKRAKGREGNARHGLVGRLSGGSGVSNSCGRDGVNGAVPGCR